MAKVTTIPATKMAYSQLPLSRVTKRRVAGYARVSTGNEDQASSYEAQVDYYTKFITSRADWELVEIYTDEGISGTSTKHREGFRRMIEDARAGKIDLIITKSISRFARNTVDTLTHVRELKEKGVEIWFEKENIYTLDAKGELLITIMSSLAQEEARSISENVTWGHRKRFAEGKAIIPYGSILGYKRGPNNTLVIDETQAPTVRRIYDLFVSGKNITEIKKTLEAEGHKTVHGKSKWNTSRIRSILTNEKYKGDLLIQKTFTSDFLTKTQKANEGEVPQYYVAANHEPIIDPKVWDQVQYELVTRFHDRRLPKTGLFAGKLICGHCGAYMGRKYWYQTNNRGRVVWQCNHKYKDKDAICPSPNISQGKMERCFLEALNSFLQEYKTPSSLKRSVVDYLDSSRLAHEIDKLSTRLKAIEDQINEAIVGNQQRVQDQDEYLKTYKELETTWQKTNEQLSALKLQKQDVDGKRQTILNAIEELPEDEQRITEVKAGYWNGLVDVAKAYQDRIDFIFKNGRCISIDI